uniref:BTB domain-containing protein n=1 Tax=Ursus maritimus TaxID=29073 RepID=A0A452TVN4_URSMA
MLPRVRSADSLPLPLQTRPVNAAFLAWHTLPIPAPSLASEFASVSDSAHRSSDPLPAQKDGLGLPLPDRRTPSWPPSPDGDPGLPPFPLEEAVPRPVAPGNLPSPALSLEEDEGEENEDEEDAAELEGLRSEEHPSQFFNEARRLREQRLLLDEEVSVAGRVYGVHRVILAALTFAYEGFLGPAPWGDVLVVAEALGAPRVKAAAQRRGKGAGSPGEDEKQPSQAEELRENLRNIELLYKDGVGCDLELEAGGCRLRDDPSNLWLSLWPVTRNFQPAGWC